MGEKRLSEYLDDHRKENTPMNRIQKKRQDRKWAEIENLELQTYIAQAKKELLEAQGTPQGVQPNQTQNVVAPLLAGRSPEEVKQILASLGPEEIQNLALLTASQNNAQTAVLMKMIGQKDTSVKDTIDLIITLNKMSKPESSGGSSKEIIEAFKVGLEAAKANQPVHQEKESAMELAMKYIKPMYDTMTDKDKALYTAQLANIESRIVDPIAYLERIKEVAPSLGLIPAGQSGSVNMELEKMKLDNERWRIEESWKREDRLEEMGLKRQSEKQKMALIKDIVGKALDKAGPAIDSAVKAASNKLQSAGKTGLSAKEMENKFACPDCLAKGKTVLIDATGMPDSLTCPECERVFPRQE